MGNAPDEPVLGPFDPEEPPVETEDLPPGVRGLPASLQDIWKLAFDEAYIEYEDQAAAAEIAWSAVHQEERRAREFGAGGLSAERRRPSESSP